MYIIEGNIGAGKTTFLRLLGHYVPYVATTFEPLHNWQNQVYGQSLLANFYQNPKRWAYTLESLAMICRVRDHEAEQNFPNPYKVIERSIYSGYYCFARNSFANDFMTELEWNLYTAWFNFLIPGKCHAPLGFIYLRTDPNIAYERVKKRNRHAEKKITLKYLKQIHERHEDFLINKTDLLPGLAKVPVLILDCNAEFESNTIKLQEHLTAVEQFIHKTQPPVPTPSPLQSTTTALY